MKGHVIIIRNTTVFERVTAYDLRLHGSIKEEITRVTLWNNMKPGNQDVQLSNIKKYFLLFRKSLEHTL